MLIKNIMIFSSWLRIGLDLFKKIFPTAVPPHGGNGQHHGTKMGEYGKGCGGSEVIAALCRGLTISCNGKYKFLLLSG